MNVSGFWCYSGDAGVATAAYLHVKAATPQITEPSQSLFRWQIGDVIELARSGRPTMSLPCRKGRGWV